MNATEVRIQAQTTSGLVLDEVTSLKWVKEAIRNIIKIHSKAGKKVTDIITAEADQAYTLTKELACIINVKDNSKTLVSPMLGFAVDSDNTITFSKSGVYDVTYYSYPTPPQVSTDEIPLPLRFQDCIEFYLAFKMRARLFGQRDESAVAFYDQFQNSLLDANLS